MPKRIFFESLVHHITRAAQRRAAKLEPAKAQDFLALVRGLRFTEIGRKIIEIRWAEDPDSFVKADCSEAILYTRGDSESSVEKQRAKHLLSETDQVQSLNEDFFDKIAEQIHQRSSVPCTLTKQ